MEALNTVMSTIIEVINIIKGFFAKLTEMFKPAEEEGDESAEA